MRKSENLIIAQIIDANLEMDFNRRKLLNAFIDANIKLAEQGKKLFWVLPEKRNRCQRKRS